MRAEVYIDRGGPELNKSIFDALIVEREALESQVGEPLTWDRMDDKKACRIAAYRSGSIDDDPMTLEEVKAWAIKRLLSLKKAFGPRLKKLLKNKPVA
jgi:hypothetical protein